MEMVCVPAGEFLMGSAESDSVADDGEKPQHTVALDAFWIDKTEVTNAQYRKCIDAGACTKTGCWEEPKYGAPDQPVVCLTWDNASKYAAWAGGRLPTEAEWEKAARGSDGRLWPWGNEPPDCTRANFSACADRPAAVGSYPAGASPYGALDMAGNVWEWVADWYRDGYYTSAPVSNPQGPDAGEDRVVRGGSCASNEGVVRCAYRYSETPNYWGVDGGFRVVVPVVSGS
jgi:formylglycine-generating enzyme required for sulfatase activity